jgi:Na+/H+ antiporter NhaA
MISPIPFCLLNLEAILAIRVYMVMGILAAVATLQQGIMQTINGIIVVLD